ncbi:methyltransferase domain-containing protein [bacterium]|nr:methyltransferase domain-containing protein [bacterium]
MIEYYEHFRSDVLKLVPDSAERFLTIGCGTGRTEQSLVESGRSVVGIEMNEEAAAVARERGLIMHVGSVEDSLAKIQDEEFDCLIFADVLEHLTKPEEIVAICSERLVQGGYVVISVPNFRHCSVFWRLFVKGEVGYEDAGIFDRTHLRITTRRMVADWYAAAGLTVQETTFSMSRSKQAVSTLLFGLPREFIGKQVLMSAKKC